MEQTTAYTPEIITSAHLLMRELLKLKDTRFVDGSKINSIVTQLGIRDLQARIYFLRELHGLVRKLPLKIYSDDQERERLMTAVQDALDRAIDDEEAEE